MLREFTNLYARLKNRLHNMYETQLVDMTWLNEFMEMQIYFGRGIGFSILNKN